MQYTVSNVPPHLDRMLRERAKKSGKSLNEVTLETLLHGAGLGGRPAKRRDLGDVAGTWLEDPDCDEALEDQRKIRVSRF